eukprot:CAMPEP_0177570784 /NCGR_PEP_ID=MMETSP0369-20130122/77047_1 /TAXON_ID=447022 ORGANISM="Scrippsiella hangoei-like, Strain SHHI-4" /NCGR_SAMPLE_ID=MMETSP0369 /ASSEMBLY_ACC=CAM_ASM_000364 /LENGTH=39 /DNA_ID= /DNA_START= /DNA_END= /DNA_ORIENTATION=
MAAESRKISRQLSMVRKLKHSDSPSGAVEAAPELPPPTP